MNEQANLRTGGDDDLTGRRLGNYVLIRRLGRGGMANVYLANQTSLGRAVAIKVLRTDLARQPLYVERFHREAQAAAALIQANIVQIHEVGELDGLHFIAQEYVRGQNLRQYLNRHQVVEPILAVSIMRQAAAALNKAAEQGVIHRDIKPENIMLTPGGEVKVTDFGLARVMDDTRTDLTQIGITMGTPLYMSPEQAEGGPVDSRSDLYSLGITAWHMLAGRPPFQAETALAIAVQHVKQDLPDLASLRPDLMPELVAIVEKLASKQPADRFQNPQQLIRQLRNLDFDDIADWELLSERLSVDDSHSGSLTVPRTRLEVTRQLETIMRGQFQPWWRSRRLVGSCIILALLGIVAGVVQATVFPAVDPLAARIEVDDRIPRQTSASEQYFYALWIVDPERAERAWMAVGEYFPAYDKQGQVNEENRLRGQWADVRLGDLYLQSGQYPKAGAVFDRLARLEETEENFRLIGLAGQALVFDAQGDTDQVMQLLPELQKDLDKFMGFMGDEVRRLLEKHRPAAGPDPQEEAED